MKYLLDTNIVSFLMKRREKMIEKLRHVALSDCVLSTLTAYELRYGALRHTNPDYFLQQINDLRFNYIEYDGEDARRSAEIRAVLSKSGNQIGPIDVLIAGQALARNLILVTNNTREFNRVPGLHLEDWEA